MVFIFLMDGKYRQLILSVPGWTTQQVSRLNKHSLSQTESIKLVYWEDDRYIGLASIIISCGWSVKQNRFSETERTFNVPRHCCRKLTKIPTGKSGYWPQLVGSIKDKNQLFLTNPVSFVDHPCLSPPKSRNHLGNYRQKSIPGHIPALEWSLMR